MRFWFRKRGISCRFQSCGHPRCQVKDRPDDVKLRIWGSGHSWLSKVFRFHSIFRRFQSCVDSQCQVKDRPDDVKLRIWGSGHSWLSKVFRFHSIFRRFQSCADPRCQVKDSVFPTTFQLDVLRFLIIKTLEYFDLGRKVCSDSQSEHTNDPKSFSDVEILSKIQEH